MITGIERSGNDGRWLFQNPLPWLKTELNQTIYPKNILIQLDYLANDRDIHLEIARVREREIGRYRKTIEEIQNSTSWKVTRPLRRLKELLWS